MTTGEPPHGTPSAAGCSGALMSREQNAKDNLVTKTALAHAPADLPFDGHSPNPAEMSLCSKRHPPLRLSWVPGAAQSPAHPARVAEGLTASAPTAVTLPVTGFWDAPATTSPVRTRQRVCTHVCAGGGRG